MIQIIHIEGARKGDIEDFDGKTITLGRNPACDVVFPADSLYIARQHAKIANIAGDYVFTNYGSNGSAVNGIRVDSTVLTNGDVITLSVDGPKVSFLCKNIHSNRDSIPTTKLKSNMGTSVENSRHAISNPDEISNRNLHSKTSTDNGEFTLQYGSNIRSFKKFSVNLGQHIENDFPIHHPALSDYHAKLFYLNQNYYIKDLNDFPVIKINGQIVSPDHTLCIKDVISLTNTGPEFCYLGDGKFSEYKTRN